MKRVAGASSLKRVWFWRGERWGEEKVRAESGGNVDG